LQTMEVLSHGSTISIGFPALATGFVVSAIIGILALKLVIHLLYRAQFRVFSYYVWALAAVVAISTFAGIL
jgi:undecaprenyl-diphosphatase